MPQKKNPDAAELARGKTGRVVGNWVALVTLLKGLPMTYNRDLQEDKERLFDTVDTIDAVLAVLTPMLRVLEVKADACKAAASDPVLLATDVADWLVGRGMPFREAHHVVGRLVRVCEERGIGLDRLPLESWMEVSPLFSSEVIELFKLPDALEKRTMVGAPSRDRVMVEIHRWNEVLSSPRA
jgi:argininosuccinate lyase